MKWALSVVDMQYHAVDEQGGDHAVGMYTAECGHQLMRALTHLRDRPRADLPPCQPCALMQLAALPPEEFGATCRRAGSDDPPVVHLDPRPEIEDLSMTLSWYLRSKGSHDTHRANGTHRDGAVMALCGVRFRPMILPCGTKALSGDPPDPEQVCPKCRDWEEAR